MGYNAKISELPYASRIDDDALVVLVQDHANKVVTVDELSNKINEKQNNVIDKLWHDLRRVTNADTIKAISDSLANHEYRIDNIERLNGKQDKQLVALTDAMQYMTAREDAHHHDIAILRHAVTENRTSLAYTNVRIDNLSYTMSSYFSAINTIDATLKDAMEKHDADLAYTYQYIADSHDDAVNLSYAYTSYELDNNWAYTYSAYAYLSDYVHFGGDEYWGIMSNSAFFEGVSLAPNDSYVKKTDTSNPGTAPAQDKCADGCGC